MAFASTRVQENCLLQFQNSTLHTQGSIGHIRRQLRLGSLLLRAFTASFLIEIEKCFCECKIHVALNARAAPAVDPQDASEVPQVENSAVGVLHQMLGVR